MMSAPSVEFRYYADTTMEEQARLQNLLYEALNSEVTVHFDSGLELRAMRNMMLGRGGFGLVFGFSDCSHKARSMSFAVKFFNSSSEGLQSMVIERNILLGLREHLGDQPFYSNMESSSHGVVIAGHRFPCIVFPIAHALPLSYHMLLGAEAIRGACKELVAALKCIHDAGVGHCDLKPSNLLLLRWNGSIILQIADFGSGIMCAAAIDAHLRTEMYRGTAAYSSPWALATRDGEQLQYSVMLHDYWGVLATSVEILTRGERSLVPRQRQCDDLSADELREAVAAFVGDTPEDGSVEWFVDVASAALMEAETAATSGTDVSEFFLELLEHVDISCTEAQQAQELVARLTRERDTYKRHSTELRQQVNTLQATLQRRSHGAAKPLSVASKSPAKAPALRVAPAAPRCVARKVAPPRAASPALHAAAAKRTVSTAAKPLEARALEATNRRAM